MTLPGASGEPSRAARGLVWIAPALALAAMAAVVALALVDTRTPRGPATRIELPLATAQSDAVPDPDLVEQSPDGPLPIVGKDGRQPWQVYARAFDAKDTRPRLAIVVAGLGLDAAATKAAIAALPPEVSLAFSPYAHELPALIGAARAAGHEVLLGLPLEPSDYPRRDPGPDTLLTSLDPQQNLDRLKHVMGRGVDYVGLVGSMGDRFAADRGSLDPVLEELKARGLLYVDDTDPQQSAVGPLAQSLGMAWALSDRRIDDDPAPQAVDQALGDLETRATHDGAALGLGQLYPVTLDRVTAWAKTLAAKGIVLAPATAVAGRQKLPQTAAQQ